MVDNVLADYSIDSLSICNNQCRIKAGASDYNPGISTMLGHREDISPTTYAQSDITIGALDACSTRAFSAHNPRGAIESTSSTGGNHDLLASSHTSPQMCRSIVGHSHPSGFYRRKNMTMELDERESYKDTSERFNKSIRVHFLFVDPYSRIMCLFSSIS